MRPTTRALSIAAAIVLAAAVSHDAAAQTPQERFTGGPVTLADQGSFFIGGVTKISEHASIPGAPPNQPVPAPTPQQITIGQMVRAVPDPREDRGTPARAEKQGTAKADYFKLDEMGMLGVTHMMMLDTKNLEIADLMLDWAGKHVAKAPKR